MNPQNPYILFGWWNTNSPIECKIDDNYIATGANINLWKLTIGLNNQAIIWNGSSNSWKYIYNLVDSTNNAFLNLNYILDGGAYKDARFVLHTNWTNNWECEIAFCNNINYNRGFYFKAMMRGWWWSSDSFAIYQCNVATIIFDYNLTTTGNINFGYPIKWNSATQTTTTDNNYITYYQYKNLTWINNNILWIAWLLKSEATQYYVLNYDGINFQYWLLGDNNLNSLWQWKITNLWTDLSTINTTLSTHTTNIWTLQGYFTTNK